MLNLFLKQQAAVVPWGIPSLLVRVFQVMDPGPFFFPKKQMFRETKSQNDSLTWIVFGLYKYRVSHKLTSDRNTECEWVFFETHVIFEALDVESVTMRLEGSKGYRSCMLEIHFEQSQATHFSFPKSSAVKSLLLFAPFATGTATMTGVWVTFSAQTSGTGGWNWNSQIVLVKTLSLRDDKYVNYPLKCFTFHDCFGHACQ